jgi:hypothetical protein
LTHLAALDYAEDPPPPPRGVGVGFGGTARSVVSSNSPIDARWRDAQTFRQGANNFDSVLAT